MLIFSMIHNDFKRSVDNIDEPDNRSIIHKIAEYLASFVKINDVEEQNLKNIITYIKTGYRNNFSETEKPVHMEQKLVEKIHEKYQINDQSGGTRSYQTGGDRERAAFILNLINDSSNKINLTDIYDSTPEDLTTALRSSRNQCYFTIDALITPDGAAERLIDHIVTCNNNEDKYFSSLATEMDRGYTMGTLKNKYQYLPEKFYEKNFTDNIQVDIKYNSNNIMSFKIINTSESESKPILLLWRRNPPNGWNYVQYPRFNKSDIKNPITSAKEASLYFFDKKSCGGNIDYKSFIIRKWLGDFAQIAYVKLFNNMYNGENSTKNIKFWYCSQDLMNSTFCHIFKVPAIIQYGSNYITQYGSINMLELYNTILTFDQKLKTKPTPDDKKTFIAKHYTELKTLIEQLESKPDAKNIVKYFKKQLKRTEDAAIENNFIINNIGERNTLEDKQEDEDNINKLVYTRFKWHGGYKNFLGIILKKENNNYTIVYSDGDKKIIGINEDIITNSPDIDSEGTKIFEIDLEINNLIYDKKKGQRRIGLAKTLKDNSSKFTGQPNIVTNINSLVDTQDNKLIIMDNHILYDNIINILNPPVAAPSPAAPAAAPSPAAPAVPNLLEKTLSWFNVFGGGGNGDKQTYYYPTSKSDTDTEISKFVIPIDTSSDRNIRRKITPVIPSSTEKSSRTPSSRSNLTPENLLSRFKAAEAAEVAEVVKEEVEAAEEQSYGPIAAFGNKDDLVIIYDVVRTTTMDTDKQAGGGTKQLTTDAMRLLQELDDDDDDEYAAMQSGGSDNNKFLLSIKEKKDLIRDEDSLSSISKTKDIELIEEYIKKIYL